ncbi:MAG: four helix bundle protein [Polyangiaceae bacterium]|nr:four helix bundle protein [Polyangiaceae bacterium]
MSLAIYPVTLDVVRGVQPLIQQIKREDPNLADQLRRAVTSVPLNLSEGRYSQGKNCRARFFNALGSAGEVRACLDVAEAMRYVETIDPGLRDRIDHVIATLYRLTLR